MSAVILAKVRGVPIFWDADTGRMWFTDGMTIDADGSNGQTSKPCYGPDNTGLDYTADAGVPGNWWALVTNGLGDPVIQSGGIGDPAAGFYISTTSYKFAHYDERDVRRYLDAAAVPFIVLPAFLRSMVAPIVLGCKARVTWGNQHVDCLVGDFGPSTHAGEASMAVAEALGLDPNPRTGGTNAMNFLYECWPGQVAVVEGVTYELQSMSAAMKAVMGETPKISVMDW